MSPPSQIFSKPISNSPHSKSRNKIAWETRFNNCPSNCKLKEMPCSKSLTVWSSCWMMSRGSTVTSRTHLSVTKLYWKVDANSWRRRGTKLSSRTRKHHANLRWRLNRSTSVAILNNLKARLHLWSKWGTRCKSKTFKKRSRNWLLSTMRIQASCRSTSGNLRSSYRCVKRIEVSWSHKLRKYKWSQIRERKISGNFYTRHKMIRTQNRTLTWGT